jgi:hypothetical protein
MSFIENDWIVQQHIRETTSGNKFLPTDFYWERGKMIMTESYHKRRGSCCGNKCLHCPYEPKYQKGNIVTK